MVSTVRKLEGKTKLTKQPEVATELDGVPNEEPNGGSMVLWCLSGLDDEGAGEIAPTVCSAFRGQEGYSQC